MVVHGGSEPGCEPAALNGQWMARARKPRGACSTTPALVVWTDETLADRAQVGLRVARNDIEIVLKRANSNGVANVALASLLHGSRQEEP